MKKLTEWMKHLIAEYGPIAFATYFAIFFAVLGGFAVAIAAGVEVESAAGGAGVLGAAWVATKVTQPLRIVATLALTPVIGGAVHRLRGKRGPAEPPSAPPAEPAPTDP